jgi:cell division septum initiation protein DivIVA
VADLATRIEQLEEMVTQAKAMPLSSSVLLNREELLDAIKDMRELLPEEIKQAKWVVKDREELLAKGRERAEQMIEDGRKEQERLVGEQAVTEAAEDEARRIIADAEGQAHRVRREADDYVDSKLEQMESVLRRSAESMNQARDALTRSTDQVSRGRRHLRGEAV